MFLVLVAGTVTWYWRWYLAVKESVEFRPVKIGFSKGKTNHIHNFLRPLHLLCLFIYTIMSPLFTYRLALQLFS
jgi:hypothetical protein